MTGHVPGRLTASLLAAGTRVEHEHWTGPRHESQHGTVLVTTNGDRQVAWDGTSCVDPLTDRLAAHLITI